MEVISFENEKKCIFLPTTGLISCYFSFSVLSQTEENVNCPANFSGLNLPEMGSFLGRSCRRDLRYSVPTVVLVPEIMTCWMAQGVTTIRKVREMAAEVRDVNSQRRRSS